ncbi:glycerophosphodiester phosphodiesterase [Streptococcus uberis]|uniref:glycerophosphodiester phosphodiesterase n=1 Tax=Streptococcus uberis TaxID=1349 RepID=UPI001FF16E14|nr:glycerophosphodiester phosphodiesterase [Streptococcus uberis]
MFKTVMKNLSQVDVMTLVRMSFFEMIFISLSQFILSESFYLLMALVGFDHIDKTNFLTFIKNPLSIALLLIYFFILAFLIHLEFFILYRIIEDKTFSLRVSVQDVKKYLFRIWHLFQGINLLCFMAYLLLTIPVLQFGLKSVITEKLYIPDFIIGELLKNPSSKLFILLLVMVIFYLNIRFVFVLPLLSIHSITVLEAIKVSWNKTKKKSFYYTGTLGFLGLFTFITLSLLIIFFFFVDTIFNPSGSHYLFQFFLMVLIWESVFFVTIFFKITIAIFLKNQLKRNATPRKNVTVKRSRLITLMIFVTVLFTIKAFDSLAVIQPPRQKMIIAHRGYTNGGVENSIESLQAAAKAKSDFVEVDLLMTKDKELVVCHDNHLKRLAGLDKTISGMTLKEVEKTTIKQGKFKSKIVSFSTFYKEAKKLKMPLFIELKPKENQVEEYVNVFLKAYQQLSIEANNRVMSLDLESVKRIEDKAPQIVTGYIIPFQFGFLGNEKVDFYVIEDFSYRSHIASQIKLQKKQLFVWTINDMNRMQNYLQKPIDGLITDYPSQVPEALKELKRHDSYLDQLMRLLSNSY